MIRSFALRRESCRLSHWPHPRSRFLSRYYVSTAPADAEFFDPEKYITSVYPLEETQEAIRVAGARETMKVQERM